VELIPYTCQQVLRQAYLFRGDNVAILWQGLSYYEEPYVTSFKLDDTDWDAYIFAAFCVCSCPRSHCGREVGR
jgi:hypothetical protein